MKLLIIVMLICTVNYSEELSDVCFTDKFSIDFYLMSSFAEDVEESGLAEVITYPTIIAQNETMLRIKSIYVKFTYGTGDVCKMTINDYSSIKDLKDKDFVGGILASLFNVAIEYKELQSRNHLLQLDDSGKVVFVSNTKNFNLSYSWGEFVDKKDNSVNKYVLEVGVGNVTQPVAFYSEVDTIYTTLGLGGVIDTTTTQVIDTTTTHYLKPLSLHTTSYYVRFGGSGSLENMSSIFSIGFSGGTATAHNIEGIDEIVPTKLWLWGLSTDIRGEIKHIITERKHFELSAVMKLGFQMDLLSVYSDNTPWKSSGNVIIVKLGAELRAQIF